MEDTYVYLSVKLYLKDGQTYDTIQNIVQEADYSFDHDQILQHEIIDIMDVQISNQESNEGCVDPFDMPDIE
jgi:hypothetical protein|tara:strand:- start:5850 stop:6065 length:216 start_codon:yes stop_codon:yes gene_type:complete